MMMINKEPQVLKAHIIAVTYGSWWAIDTQLSISVVGPYVKIF